MMICRRELRFPNQAKTKYVENKLKTLLYEMFKKEEDFTEVVF